MTSFSLMAHCLMANVSKTCALFTIGMLSLRKTIYRSLIYMTVLIDSKLIYLSKVTWIFNPAWVLSYMCVCVSIGSICVFMLVVYVGIYVLYYDMQNTQTIVSMVCWYFYCTIWLLVHVGFSIRYFVLNHLFRTG